MVRESIYAAIFALAPAGFTTTSRRLQLWEDVKPAQMPALFQQQHAETVTGKPNMPPKIKGGVTWWIYAYADPSASPYLAPSQVLNPLLDAVENVFAAKAAIPNTLGGLVAQCYIDGGIETDEGYLGDLSVARVPIVFELGG